MAGLHTPTVARLITLWESFAGETGVQGSSSGVTPSSNLVSQGLTSLEAIAFLARVETAFGVRQDLRRFLANATIIAIANSIEEDGRSASFVNGRNTPIVLAATSGDSTSAVPVYCFHPLPGTVTSYVDLADRLGPEYVAWGVQASSLDEETNSRGEEEQPTVELMGRAYAEAILAVHSDPTIDIHLLGYSFGAALAFEAARQLLIMKAPVGVVVLIDAAALDDHEGDESQPRHQIEASALRVLAEHVVGLDLNWDTYAGLSTEQKLDLLVEQGMHHDRLSPDFTRRKLARFVQTRVDNRIAAARYRPVFLDHEVALIRAHSDNLTADETLGWGDVSRRCSVHSLPGDHFSVLNQEVDATARLVRSLLDTVAPRPR